MKRRFGAGDRRVIDRFVTRLVAERPPLARIEAVTTTDLAPLGTERFEIVASAAADGRRTLVPPDVATCDACLADLHDPTDRRSVSSPP